jgi:WD40 repeat protein
MWSANGDLIWKISHEGILSTMSFAEGDEDLVVAHGSGMPGLAATDPDHTRRHHDHHVPSGPGQTRGSILSASKVLFNPNPGIELLAVSYQDGELAIFKTWAGGDHEIKSLSADAFTLAVTSDGRTLASGDARGMIKIWDFETLSLLYCTKSTEHEIRELAFSADGFRLHDIRDTLTRIWEPAMLVRAAIDEESGINTSVAPVVGRDRAVVDIMRIHAPPDAGCVFAGRDDGSVVAYDWDTGDMISTIYSHHRGRLVTNITWNHSMIATATFSRHIEAHVLTRPAPSHPWVSAGKQFEIEVDESIRELFLHPKEPWLLIFQAKQSTVIDIRTGDQHLLPIKVKNDYQEWLWLSWMSLSNILLGARSHSIDIYEFATLDSEWQTRVWNPTMGGNLVEQPIDCILADKQEKHIAVLLQVTHIKHHDLRDCWSTRSLTWVETTTTRWPVSPSWCFRLRK